MSLTRPIQKIVRFLLRLRTILRNNPLACALVTLPADISSESWAGEGWLEKISWVSDACISLNSSTGEFFSVTDTVVSKYN